MIISKDYADRLVRLGRAAYVGEVAHDGKRWMCVDRYDVQRTDHYLI